MSPNVGTVGTWVTISGQGFTDATSVAFGPSYAQFTVINDTTIYASAPTIFDLPDPYTADVVVSTPDGVSPIVSADQFQYQSAENHGQVASSPILHAIFWVPASGTLQDGTPFNFPSTDIDNIVKFVQDLALPGNGWWNIMGQYGVGPPTYGGATINTSDYPTEVDFDCFPTSSNCIGGGTIRNLVQEAISSNPGWGESTNDIYVVILAPGEHAGPAGSGCGYNGGGGILAGDESWAVVETSNCTGTVPGPYDSVTNTAVWDAAHEIAEAVSDPHAGLGWEFPNDGNNDQIADACEYFTGGGSLPYDQGSANVKFPNGDYWYLPALFSNEPVQAMDSAPAGDQGTSGCVWDDPTGSASIDVSIAGQAPVASQASLPTIVPGQQFNVVANDFAPPDTATVSIGVDLGSQPATSIPLCNTGAAGYTPGAFATTDLLSCTATIPPSWGGSPGPHLLTVSDGWGDTASAMVTVVAGYQNAQQVQSTGAFRGVACLDDGTCLAVGSSQATPSVGQVTVLNSDGSFGTPVSIPGMSLIFAVGCGSTQCIAVGVDQNGNPGFTSLSPGGAVGSVEAIEVSNTPVGTVSRFYDVACPTDDTCIATGSQSSIFGPGSTSLYAVLQAGQPATAQSSPDNLPLGELVCTSAVSCLATGSLGVNLISDTAAGWTVSPGPPSSIAVTTIACFGSSCLGLGPTGQGWVVVSIDPAGDISSEVSMPPSAVVPYFSDLACVSVTACLAVGMDNATSTGLLVPILSGQPQAGFDSAGSNLFTAVACARAEGSCDAVGFGSSDVGVEVQMPLAVVAGPSGFTSAMSAVATAGQPFSVTITADGTPPPSLTETGALPEGVSFDDQGDGSALLYGTPALGTGGTYNLSVTAANQAGTSIGSFALTVVEVADTSTVASITVSPTTATTPVGVGQSYEVEGFDASQGDLGNFTMESQFSISPDGSCTLNVCVGAAPGPHTVTAVLGSISDSVSLSVVPATSTTLTSTTLSVVSSDNPSAYGDAVILTAIVTPTAGDGTPTGTVTFTDGSITLGTAPLGSDGQAILGFEDLAVGTHEIGAQYSGDSDYLSSSSSVPLTQVVDEQPTTTATISTENPAPYGDPVVFDVVVSPDEGTGAPTGEVTVSSGDTVLAQGDLDSSGQLVFATASLPVGSYPITTSYAGDGSFAPSVDTSLTLVITSTTSTVSLTPSANPATYGSSVTLTAEPENQNDTVLTVGSVTFSQDGPIGTVPVNDEGVATLTLPTLDPGTYSYTANYSGPSGVSPSTSPPLTETISPGDQAITFTSNAPTDATVGGPTYQVAATGGASGNPVTFLIDSSALGVCSINGSTVSFIGAGTCVIDANQAGGGGYLAAPQGQQSFSVGQGTPSSPIISNVPSDATFAGSFVPVVSTTSDGVTSVTSSTPSVCSVDSGTVSFVGVGTCTLTAEVAASADYLAAAGSPQSFAVTEPATAPSVTKVTPSYGPASGGTRVTITGVHLVTGDMVEFGATQASVVSVNRAGTSMVVTSPPGTGTVGVSVISGDQQSLPTSADDFSYGPLVTKVTPTTGPPGGRTTVTITGHNFTGASAVGFGAAGAGTIVSVNAAGTTIVASSPPEATSASGAPETVDVTVTSSNGTSPVVPGDTFTYVAPSLTRLSVASGSGGGGTTLNVVGTDLLGTSSVTFGGGSAAITKVTNTYVAVVTPPGGGTVDVVLTTPAGTATLVGAFTYLAPTVTKITPTSGSAGTTVTITGTNFEGASEVLFGGLPASSFTVLPPAYLRPAGTKITAVAPSGSGTVAVTVVNDAGSSPTVTADDFSY